MPTPWETLERASDRIAAKNLEAQEMRDLLRIIRDRDVERNLFDCPSGGWIRQQLKRFLNSE